MVVLLRYDKTGNKKHANCFAIRVEQRCCALVPPTKNSALATLFVRRQVRTPVVNRATSLFSQFCGHVAEHVTRFFVARFNVALSPRTDRMTDGFSYPLYTSASECLPLNIPEAWKRYPFQAEPIGFPLERNCLHLWYIDLVTVFDAILTSRQTREKLQCLYENLMSNNFRRMAVLNKISIVN